jgi:hypothetical protein
LAIASIKKDFNDNKIFYIHSGLKEFKMRARNQMERNAWYSALIAS